MFGKLGKKLGVQVNVNAPVPNIGVNVHGQIPNINVHGQVPNINIHGQAPNINIHGQAPKVGVNVQGQVPNVGMNVQSNLGMNFDMYKIPDSAHAHPLIKVPSLTGECKLCRMNAAGQAGYRCEGCDVILCFNCSNRVFYGNKHKNCHPQHPLALTSRKGGWKCDLCKTHSKGGASFYCKPCDFDACNKCYIDVGFPQGFTPPPITFFQMPDTGFSSSGKHSNTGFSSSGQSDTGFSSSGKQADPGFSSSGKQADPGFSSSGKKVDAGFSSSGKQVDPGFSSSGKKVDAGFSSSGKKDAPGFSSSGKKVDAGFSSSGQVDAGFSSSGKPIDPGFSSSGHDPELINRLNETIKSYEAKLKVSETDFINLKKSSMDERGKLQATIDSLNQQLSAKDGQIKQLQIDIQNLNQTIHKYDGDMGRMRIDLDKLVKERDGLVFKSNQDLGEIGRLNEENKNLNFQLSTKTNELANTGNIINNLNKRVADLEFQLKGRDDQIFQINGKHAEDRKQLQIQIDTINAQLIVAQDQLKKNESLFITIKNYEAFLNKLKVDITQFQSSSATIQIGPVPLPGLNIKIK